MKKTLLLIALGGTLTSLAQTGSFQLFNYTASNASIAPNSTITATTIENDNTKVTIDVKNTTANTQNYHAKRYDVLLNSSGTIIAQAYFCFGGSCYGTTTYTSPSALTLSGGQSASSLTTQYQMLTTDLDETPVVGKSIVKYTVFNDANSNDSIQFTIYYNKTLGIKSSKNELAQVELSPNPAVGSTTLKFNSVKSFETSITIINSIGQAVSEKKLQVLEGKNKVTLETDYLPAGVYFVSIGNGNAALTRKLVIN